jgi:hypothetical protein
MLKIRATALSQAQPFVQVSIDGLQLFLYSERRVCQHTGLARLAGQCYKAWLNDLLIESREV